VPLSWLEELQKELRGVWIYLMPGGILFLKPVGKNS